MNECQFKKADVAVCVLNVEVAKYQIKLHIKPKLVLELAAHETSGCDHKPSFGARGASPWSRLMGSDQMQGDL